MQRFQTFAAKPIAPWLYMVTPSLSETNELVNVVEKALRGGVNIVQLRNKIYAPDSIELKTMALALRDLTREYKVPLIINDHVSLAFEIGADGAHIGQEDISVQDAKHLVENKDFILGVTVRDAIQAQAACEAGATYLGVGPVFPSTTKKNANNGKIIGIEGLHSVVVKASEFDVPVVGIGGINLNRIPECMQTHATGVAVVAALSSAEDVELTASSMLQSIRQHYSP